ncbi:MAG: ABC transporter permease, partial [Roseiflexaceae bacterium]|nr:ABC transporter permease [Roseiflexaceae bacterium]
MTTLTPTTRTAAPAPAERKQRSLWGDAWRRLISSFTGRLGLAITLALVLTALLIPVIRPYSPDRDRNLRLRLTAPSWSLPAAERERLKLDLFTTPFGTDELGRDLFVRVLHGSRISLSVGLFSVALAVIFGSLLGLVAGFIGG